MDDWRKRAEFEMRGVIGEALRDARPRQGESQPGPIRAFATGPGAIAIGGDVHVHVRVDEERRIGDLEAAKLKGMVARIVQLEGATGAGHRDVYAKLQETFRIATLRDLPRADFAMAVQLLDAWIARLRAAKSVVDRI